MAWLESHQELGQHPKTKKAARLLGISLPQMVGHLHYLWWWAMDYCDGGDVTKYDASDLADACLWDGDPATFIGALVACGPGGDTGFLERTADGRLLIHDWEEYIGRLLEQREEAKQRTRAWREKRKSAANQRAPEPVTHNVGVAYDATVPNRTVPDQTKESGGHSARTREDDPHWQALSRALRDTAGTRLTQSAVDERDACLDELKTAGFEPGDIERLVAEYRARWPGKDITPKALKRHADTLSKPRPEAAPAARASPNGYHEKPGVLDRIEAVFGRERPNDDNDFRAGHGPPVYDVADARTQPARDGRPLRALPGGT